MRKCTKTAQLNKKALQRQAFSFLGCILQPEACVILSSTHESARTPAQSINNAGSWEIEVSQQLHRDLLKVTSVSFRAAILLSATPEACVLFVPALWMASFAGTGVDPLTSFHSVLSSLFLWLEWLGNGFQTRCLNGRKEDSLSKLSPGPWDRDSHLLPLWDPSSVLTQATRTPWLAVGLRMLLNLAGPCQTSFWGGEHLLFTGVQWLYKPENQSANQMATFCWAATTTHLAQPKWRARLCGNERHSFSDRAGELTKVTQPLCDRSWNQSQARYYTTVRFPLILF